MFWNKRTTTVIEDPTTESVEPEAVQAKPEAAGVNLGDDRATIEEWLNLCRETGIVSGKPKEMELLLFLQDEGISTYRTQSVFDYMNAEQKRRGSKWYFYPLRPSDDERVKTSCLWAAVNKWVGGDVADRCFRSRIPIPVLITVSKICKRFGDGVSFYVAAINDDPFLAVRLGDSNIVFVERWDEPAFRS